MKYRIVYMASYQRPYRIEELYDQTDWCDLWQNACRTKRGAKRRVRQLMKERAEETAPPIVVWESE